MTKFIVKRPEWATHFTPRESSSSYKLTGGVDYIFIHLEFDKVIVNEAGNFVVNPWLYIDGVLKSISDEHEEGTDE